jgi:adenosine deaminase
MKTQYPALTVMIPLCASATPADLLIEGYRLKDEHHIHVSSTTAPESIIEVTDSIQSNSMVAAFRHKVFEDIQMVLSGKDTYEEQMQALDAYIDEKQESIDEWLKTIKAAE